MPIDWDPLVEGQNFDAASLNNRFEAVHGEINSLPSSSVEARSLSRVHLGSMVPKAITKYQSINRWLDDSSHRYPGWPVSSGFPATSFEDEMPIRVGLGGASWRDMPDHGVVFDEALNFGDYPGTPELEAINGILVLANVYVPKLYANHSKHGRAATNQLHGFFMVALKQSGTYYPAPRTLRWIDSDTNTGNGHDVSEAEADRFLIPHSDSTNPAHREVHNRDDCLRDVPIRAFITKDDLARPSAGLPGSFDSVHILMAVKNNSHTYSRSTGYKTFMQVTDIRITVMALHSTVLTKTTVPWIKSGIETP